MAFANGPGIVACLPFPFTIFLPKNKKRIRWSQTLFLASTVSAWHRNANIWNASHPLLVTYYCRATVYSPGMEAKKSDYRNLCVISGIPTPNTLDQDSHIYRLSYAHIPDGLYRMDVSIPIYLNFKSQLFDEDRKIRLTPKISNHLFTCYLNCTCKSNPVCLIQQ